MDTLLEMAQMGHTVTLSSQALPDVFLMHSCIWGLGHAHNLSQDGTKKSTGSWTRLPRDRDISPALCLGSDGDI